MDSTLALAVVDAPLALSWFLPSPHARAAHVLVDQVGALWAPDVALAEAAERLAALAREGSLDADEARDVWEALHAAPWRVRLAAPHLRAALDLALDTGLPLGDALHAALARAQACPLVLGEAARRDRVAAACPDLDVRWIGDLAPLPPA